MQLVPLPGRVLNWLSPRAQEIWSQSDALLGLQRNHPISVDPPGTAFAITTAVAVALAFRASSQIGRFRGGRQALLESVAIVVQLFAAVTILHRVAGATRLFGFYEPRAVTALLAPLVNPNHAAALAAIGPPLLLGLASKRATFGGKLLAWSGAALTGIVAVLSLSRGGIAVLVVELGVMSAFLARRRDVSAGVRVAPVIAATFIALGAAYVAFIPLANEVFNSDISKLALVRSSYAAVRDFAMVGSGRGSFGSLSSIYTADLVGWVRFSHAEHWPAQLAIELGVPVAVAFSLALMWAVMRVRHRVFVQPELFGASVALGGVVIHDFADFALEYAGVGMVAATLLAAVTATSRSRRDSDSTRFGSRWLSPVLAAAVTAGAVTLAASLGAFNLEDDARAVGAAGANTSLAARFAMARHPAESYFPMTIGASGGPSHEAGRFLALAVRLAPSRASPHYWLARWFWANGRRAQAYAEYRAAVRRQDNVWPVVLNDVISAGAPLEELVVFATTAAQFESLSTTLTRASRDADASSVDKLSIVRFAPAVPAYQREIARARASNRHDEARRLAERLVAQAPNEPAGYVELAAFSDSPEGLLVEAIARIGDDPQLLTALIRARGKYLDDAALSPEVDRLRTALVARGQSPHHVFGLLAELALQKGRKAAALRHFRDGSAASPDGTAYLEAAAVLAEQLGQFDVAAEAWRKLAQVYPSDPRFPREAERVRARAALIPPP